MAWAFWSETHLRTDRKATPWSRDKKTLYKFIKDIPPFQGIFGRLHIIWVTKRPLTINTTHFHYFIRFDLWILDLLLPKISFICPCIIGSCRLSCTGKHLTLSLYLTWILVEGWFRATITSWTTMLWELSEPTTRVAIGAIRRLLCHRPLPPHDIRLDAWSDLMSHCDQLAAGNKIFPKGAFADIFEWLNLAEMIWFNS